VDVSDGLAGGPSRRLPLSCSAGGVLRGTKLDLILLAYCVHSSPPLDHVLSHLIRSTPSPQSHAKPYPVVAADAQLSIGTAVISAVFPLDEHWSQTRHKFCYQSVYSCLIRHFLLRIRIAKCFTNSSKRFRYEVMFENEHMFCS
jgi:hypothetical protein